MKTKFSSIFCFVSVFFLGRMNSFAQCTEAKDVEMAKYMKLTKTQDAQGCSQCGLLALYFCSAKYCTKIEDKKKVGAMISDIKNVIRQMGEPYCCPDYLNKEPEWGIMAGIPENQPLLKTVGTATNEKISPTYSGAENTGKAEDALNTLIKQLEVNPENPLNIDKEFLFSFSQLLPDGTLKSTLKSYGSNLGVDKDLSTRQIYSDIASGFKQNPSIAGSNQYASTGQGLKLMFENYNLVSDKLKSNGTKYEYGSFINDPAIVSSLQNITGSYENAQAVAMGVELAASIAEAFAEDKKFKDDYKKLAMLSAKNLYAESDVNLSSALIDAYLGIEGHQIITPMYRYDFNNGASLRVENGILKYFNSKTGIVRNLLIVDKRHDGNFYKHKDMRGAFYSTIIISKDESVFYLYVNPNAISEIRSEDCLKKAGYLINSHNGEIIYTKSGNLVPSAGHPGLDIFNANFDSDKGVVYNMISANNIGGYAIYNRLFKEKDGSLVLISGLDKNKNFIINGNPKKFKDDNSFQESLFDKHIKFLYLFQKDGCTLSLWWANGNKELDPNKTMYASSMLQVAKNKDYYNADGMVNELTGIVMSGIGDLYFTGKNGNIGKLNSADYKLDDPLFTSKIRSAMTSKIVASYDFIADRSYASLHGQIITHADAFPNFPSLKFTPDEKTLVYIVSDNLYIIKPDDFNNVKHYKLSCYAYNSFFTKENGEWVINIQSLNEFKFPITKKYSIDKLVLAYDSSKFVANKKENADEQDPKSSKNPKSNGNNFSLADEIKKLKELLDTGAITKDEYDEAKKQLLNK